MCLTIHVKGYFKYLGSANQNKTAILVIENLCLESIYKIHLFLEGGRDPVNPILVNPTSLKHLVSDLIGTISEVNI
jgi:hypothetical protein